MKIIKNRKKIMFTVYIFLIISIFFRYYSLQIVQYEKYKIKAGNNTIRKIRLNAPRGLIVDRWNKHLVDNQLIYDINIIPKDFDSSNFNYQLINKTLGLNKNKLLELVQINKQSHLQFKPILIKRQIDFKTKAILEENKLNLHGLYFSKFPARKYSSSCNLTHVLGYLRQAENDENDVSGFSGIEKYYNSQLTGVDGAEYHLVDRFGIDQGLFDVDKNYNPIQGDSLVLTIDKNLQSYCESLVNQYKGSIIVMDSKSGEIYSMVSFPDYNLDSFVGPIPTKTWDNLVNDSNKPFNNRALQNTYSPGSIFKLVLGAVALEHQIIDTSWKINCNGQYNFHDTIFRCWKEDGHGEVSITEAIQQSCNVFFYNLIQKIDFELWHEEALKFGFGNITGVDLPFEKKGIVPNRKYMSEKYKKTGGWSGGHLLNLSIGQGEITTTPLQVINLINIIANEGYAYTPHINKNDYFDKQKTLYRKNTFKTLKKGMYKAVYENGGTAYNARISNDSAIVFGKTGTAQLCSNCDVEPHAWFAGLIQLKDGKSFSICVLIENGGKGSNLSTKIAKKIFNYILGENV